MYISVLSLHLQYIVPCWCVCTCKKEYSIYTSDSVSDMKTPAPLGEAFVAVQWCTQLEKTNIHVYIMVMCYLVEDRVEVYLCIC